MCKQLILKLALARLGSKEFVEISLNEQEFIDKVASSTNCLHVNRPRNT